MRISDWSSDVCSSDLLVLQISGLFTVVVGLDESRQLFGKPTFIAAARSSVVRLGLWVRSLFIKPKPVNYIITPMNIESRTEVSGGRVTVHGGSLEQIGRAQV